MENGFLFNQLSEFKQDIMRSIKDKFPDSTTEFIKEEAKKIKKVAQKVAKKEVGTSKGKKKNWDEKKSYHKKFKVGKPYKYAENDYCIRAYNASPHGHLVEYGHINVPRGEKRATTRAGREEQNASRTGSGFTLGKYVFKIAETQFLTEYLNDCEAFMTKFVENTVKGLK